MWLSKQQKQFVPEGSVQTGRVTIPGETVAVELDGERRGLTVYGPGGYRWRPAEGEKVLVFKTGDGLCVAGVPADTSLEEGEVGLFAPGGAAITLRKSGRVDVDGEVAVRGALSVNEEDLETLVRRMIAEQIGT